MWRYETVCLLGSTPNRISDVLAFSASGHMHDGLARVLSVAGKTLYIVLRFSWLCDNERT